MRSNVRGTQGANTPLLDSGIQRCYTDSMMNKEAKMTINPDVRSYALELIENGLVDTEVLLRACLGYMRADDVAHMLDLNELSPRFMSEAINHV